MTLVCGLDDAGRGPVIGPMVLAGITIEEKDIGKLRVMGIKDSKLIAPKKRELMYKDIIKVVKNYKIVKISPQEIDDALNSSNLNLNWLEAIKFAVIINALKPQRAIVDCPSTNTKAYHNYLKTYLKQKTSLKCEHKADLKYVTVGAASILAKVTRDREIQKIKTKIKMDFGSGYPSDKRTQDFIKENWKKYPDIFRKTWSTYTKLADNKQQSLKNF